MSIIYLTVLKELKYHCTHLKRNPRKTITSSLCLKTFASISTRISTKKKKKITNPIISRVNEVPSTNLLVCLGKTDKKVLEKIK